MTRAKRTTSGVSRAAPTTSKPRVDRSTAADEAVALAVDEVVDRTVDSLVDDGRTNPTTRRPPESSGTKSGKRKVVRDRFKMAEDEYATIAELKRRLLELSRSTRKNELLRAGIAALTRLSDARLLAAVEALPSRAAGRAKGRDSGSGSS